LGPLRHPRHATKRDFGHRVVIGVKVDADRAAIDAPGVRTAARFAQRDPTCSRGRVPRRGLRRRADPGRPLDRWSAQAGLAAALRWSGRKGPPTRPWGAIRPAFAEVNAGRRRVMRLPSPQSARTVRI